MYTNQHHVNQNMDRHTKANTSQYSHVCMADLAAIYIQAKKHHLNKWLDKQS